MTELPVITVVATWGGFLRRLACALGIHRRAREFATDAYGAPTFMDYCPACGAADASQWEWTYSTHYPDVSLVSYRPRWSST